MKALDRKLLRDLARLWSQALTIALVVASGVAGFVTSLSAVDSLARARDGYYADDRFADLFGAVKRAPNGLIDSLRAVDGVADVQTTLEEVVRITIPGVVDPIIGQMIGVDRRAPHRLNRVSVSSGRGIDELTGGQRGDGSLEVLVSEAFAKARALKPGSRLTALVNGKQRVLVVVGTALSPEYVFAGLWGMPDTRGYGVFWLDRDALAAAYDMQGAFNRVAVKLAPGASPQAAADGLQHRLEPYGGREVYARDRQTSHAMLDNEIQEQRVLGTVLPAIFLGVAAFLLNVVVVRLVATQREQIAALKALGYANAAIAVHYLKLVLLIVAAGVAIGMVVGDRLGAMFTALYAEFFHFPRFEHRIAPWLFATSVTIAAVVSVAGTLNAILATVRLPPAEAMRPPAPGRFRPTLLERIGIRRLAPALRMTLRSMERRPLRTTLSVAGVAAAIAIVVMGTFVRDAIAVVIDTQLNLGLRADISVWTIDPVDDGVRHALARLPGVQSVEAVRLLQAVIRHGHRSERSVVRGYPGRGELYRVIDRDRREHLLEGRGLVLTDRLADKLGVAPGDEVEIDVLEGRDRTLRLRVGATVSEMMGLNAYLERRTLDRLLGDGDVSNGYVLAVERGAEGRVLDATKAMPRIAGAWSKATMVRNLEEISARNVRIMSTVLTAFASVIAVGVVYNNARIALAERSWELASLRVLGFTRAEVSALLLGELVLVVGVALPVGMLLGWALVHAVVGMLRSDQFDFPVAIRTSTYAWAAICVLAAAAASALVVRRHVDRLDLVAALKTRD